MSCHAEPANWCALYRALPCKEEEKKIRLDKVRDMGQTCTKVVEPNSARIVFYRVTPSLVPVFLSLKNTK